MSDFVDGWQRYRGGADLWDEGPAGQILTGEAFPAVNLTLDVPVTTYALDLPAPGIGAVLDVPLTTYTLTADAPVISNAWTYGAWDITAGGASATIASFPLVATTPAWDITAGNGGATINAHPDIDWEVPATAYTLTLPAPTLTIEGGDLSLDVPVTAYSLTQPAPLLDLDFPVPVTAYDLTGFATTIVADLNLDVPVTVYDLTLPGPALAGEVPVNSIAGGRRKRIKLVEIAGETVEVDAPLVPVVERVQKALKLNRPVQKADVQKLARLPGVKAAVERAIRERDDEEAALMLLVA